MITVDELRTRRRWAVVQKQHWQPCFSTPQRFGVGVALALVATPRNTAYSMLIAIAALWLPGRRKY